MINKDNTNIGMVVANALMDLSPELREAVVTNQYFITRIQTNVDELPIRVNNVYQKPEPKYAVLIDCTSKIELTNMDRYVEKSLQLYSVFKYIDQHNGWHEC